MLIIIPTIKKLVNSKSWLPPKEERRVTRRDRREKRGLGASASNSVFRPLKTHCFEQIASGKLTAKAGVLWIAKECIEVVWIRRQNTVGIWMARFW
jgi:hypothetical protein